MMEHVSLGFARIRLFGDYSVYNQRNYVEDYGRGSFDVKIDGDILPSYTFSRGEDYGTEIENKVYCGLLIGHDMNVGLVNCDYNILGDQVQKPGEVHRIVLPELPQGIYYVRPYLISEQERDAMERDETINPYWLRYAVYTEPYCRLEVEMGDPGIMGDYYYDGDVVEYNVRLHVKVPQIPKIPVSYPIMEFDGTWGLKRIDQLGEEYDILYDQTGSYDGVLDIPFSVRRESFIKKDTEKFRAEAKVNLVLYCKTSNERIDLGKVSCTVVYDKKPELI